MRRQGAALYLRDLVAVLTVGVFLFQVRQQAGHLLHQGRISPTALPSLGQMAPKM